jgi:hypothetical protein
LNEFETQVVSVLAAIGVSQPHPLEHGFLSAMVGGESGDRFVVVHSARHGSPQAPAYGEVVDQITIAGGAPATIVATPAFGEVVRFVCSEVAYQVASLDHAMTPGSSDVDDARRVADLMVDHLRCSA